MTGYSGGNYEAVDEPTEATTDDARTALVKKLHAAWAQSGLKQQSVEARLKTMLSGQNVRGLSDTALSRYLKLDETALPAVAVLTALARIFQVSEEELAEWHELRRQAKADQRRRRYQRTPPDQPVSAPGPRGPGPGPAGSPDLSEENTSGAPETAPPAGAEAEPPSDAGALASPPTVHQRQDTADTPEASLVRTPATPTVASAAGDEKTSVPTVSAGGKSSDTSRRGRRKPSWRDQPAWIKVLGGTVAAVVATAVVVVTTAVVGADTDKEAGDGTPAVSSPASASASAQGMAEVVPSESPGLEKGTLGEDSRCGAPLAGPGAVTWRVCARVEAERVSFALKITNHGGKASKVKIRLEYAQANEFHPCPKSPSTRLLDVPAGESVITDPGQCAVPREEAPFAYQGVGWVLAENADAASYQLSPTAHVRPDRVIWQPDVV